ANTYTITFAAGTGASGSNQTQTKTHAVDLTLPNSATANGWFTRSGQTIVGWSTSDGGSLSHALGGTFTTNSATTLYPVWTCAAGADPVVSSGLVLRLDADNTCSTGTSGKWRDVSGNSRDLSWVNSPTLGTDYGKYYEFNRGNSHYGTLTSSGLSDFTNGFSITFWARFDATAGGGWERIIDLGKGDSNENIVVAREWTSNRLVIEFRRGSTETYECSSAIITDGQWAHFSITVNSSGTCAIYKNGTSQTLFTNAIRATPFMPINIERTSNLVGDSNWTADAFFDGGIGDLAIYNRALTSSEVSTNYSAQLATPSTYTITLNKGTTGTGSNQTLTKTHGQALTLPDSATANSYFTRTGYTVTGWSTSDGGSQSHALSGSFTTDSATTLYPVWTGNTYTITYDSNGGSSASNGTFTVGGSGLTLPTVTRNGYAFAGWYEASNFSGSQLTSPYSPPQTRTVYAKWTAIGNRFADFTSAIPGSANSSGISLRFVGDGLPSGRNSWSAEAWFNEKTHSANQNPILSQGLDNGASGFAVLIVNGSTGRELSIVNGSFLPAIAVPIEQNTWNHFAYTFDNGSYRIYLNGSLVGSGTTATITDVGSFLIGENSYYQTGTARHVFHGRIDQVKIWSKPLTLAEVQTSMHARGSGGISNLNHLYTFDNASNPGLDEVGSKNLSNNGTGTAVSYSSFSMAIRTPSSGLSTTVGNVFNLPAVAPGGDGVKTFAVTAGTLPAGLSLNPASGTISGTPTSAGNQSVTVSVTDEASQTVSTSSFTISVNANTYTITYDSNGGSSASNGTFTVGGSGLTLPTVTRTGYTFAGWYEASDFSGSQLTSPYSPTQTRTVYAKWTANTYNVTYDEKGGSTVTDGTFTTGGSVELPSAPTRAGFIFGGWSATDGGSAVSSPYSPGVTSNITLYAVWITIAPPTNVQATAGNQTVTVSWLPPSTALSQPPTAYRVEYSTTGTGSWTTADATLASTVRSLEITGLSNGTNYYVRVAAVYSGVNGVYGYPWTLIFESTTPARQSTAMVYTNTNGLTGNDVDLSRTDFSRVRYYVGAKYASGDATRLFVDANFDKSMTNLGSNSETYANGNLHRLQVPTTAGGTQSQFELHGNISNLDVMSNSSAVTQGTGLSGRLEIWPWNYGPTPQTGLSGGSLNTGTYDDGDSWVAGGTYGSFQLHNIGTGAQTIFAWNNHGATPEIGFGNNVSNSNPDWTFASREGGYTQRADFLFQSYANLSVTPKGNYTISYNANSASSGNLPSNQTKIQGTNLTLASNSGNLARTGYTYAGWNTQADGSGTSFAAGATYTLDEGDELFARWTANQYAFNGNTASGSTSSLTFAGSTLIAPSNGFTVPTGFTFGGWCSAALASAAAACSGTTYLAGANLPTPASATVTLYAIWVASTFTITYEYNGADGGTRPVTNTFTTGGTAITLPTPTKTGYTFAGWFAEVGLATSVGSAGANYSPTSTTTIYAKWTANSNTVTFKSNFVGGANDATQSIVSGTATNLTSTSFTRTGYTFAGWNTLADGTGTNYTNGESVTLTGALTLFAKWTVATYTITYNYNSATGGNSVASGTFTTGGSNLVLPVPTRTGYTFAGWFDDSGFAGSALGSSISATSSKTIYAKWDAATFTVLYDYNSATGGNTTASNTFTTGSTAITPPTPTKTGYTFAGWFESSSFTGSAVSSSYTTTQNRTLYAKWTAINYTVTYNANLLVGADTIAPNSGSVPTNNTNYNIGQSFSVAANTGSLARTGYTFAGWVTNADGTGTAKNSGETITFGAANINLYPQWTPNTYTISYNLNGGSGSLSGAPTSWTVGDSNVTLPSSGFTRTGYNFAGWAKTQGGSVVNNSFNNFGNVTLYAVWTIKSISYTFGKGTAAGLTIASWPADSSANFGTTITLPSLSGTTVTISGGSYLFFGWTSGGTTYQSGSTFTLGETAPTFTAEWVQVFDVRYGFAGGTHAVAGDTDDECTTGGLCVNSQSITLRTAPTRTGYTFDGWRVQDTGTTKAAGATHILSATQYLFYAQWTAVDYDFSYNSMGGSSSHASVTANIGQLVTMPNPGSRTGYTFAGWSPDGGSTKYAIGSTFLVGTESKAFIAQWTPNVYTVVFDWQGASGTPTPDASYTVGTGSLTLPVIGDRTRDGFTFGGWSETAGGTTAVSNFVPTANDVLYAIWNDGNYTLSYNGQGASAGSGSGSVARGQSVNLPTPVRAGFVFNGWYDAETGGNKIGNGGQAHTPNRSKTMHARWVQKSLWGVDLATLESGSEYTASNSTEVDVTLTHVPTNTAARVKVPAGALPNGTKVNVQYFKDTDRQSALIPGDNSYFFSVLVSWLSGTGSSATVPNTNAGKPIEVTLTNTAIKAGAMAYMVIGDEVRELGRATQDGTITVQLTEDPEIVVAATAPANPGSVVASGGNQQATISWSAPSTNGGAQITGYTVTASPGGATCTTATTSCSITGLTNGTAYTFSVVATNSVGSSSGASSSSVTPAVVTYTVTFNSNGGSNVSNGSFTSGGSVSEPTAPTRSGFTFDGWSTTQNNAATKVTFPYSPGVTNNITLYALWTQVQSSGGSGGSGGGGSSPTPTVTPRPTPGPTPAPTPTAPPSQIGFKPTPPATPVVETGPVGTVVGSSEQVRVVKDAPSEKIVATAGSWQLEIKPPVTEETTKPVTEKLELQFPVASRAQIAGTGLQPNTTVEAWVFSEPMYVGTIKVGPDGSFASNLTLPRNLLPGQHTLQIGSLNSQGRLVTLSVPITIKGSVTVGTFRGFVAIFTKDLQGQELTARVAGKWIRQNPVRNFKTNNYSRLVRFTGAGYNIVIDVYINKKFYKRYTTRTR
ncbi:MAG: hypothetical protein F2536_05110, partial [Actinobacteria bacterium]|nr:hypothetical protein [Actinomycetota bacterium]